MRFLICTLCFCCCLSGNLRAEWQRTDGPNGGNIDDLVLNGETFQCIVGGALHEFNGERWERRVETSTLEIVPWRDKLVGYRSEGRNFIVLISDDGGANWRWPDLPWWELFSTDHTGYLHRMCHANDEALFVGLDREVYFTRDGETWTRVADFTQHAFPILSVFGKDDETFIWLSVDNRLFRYDNAGQEAGVIVLPGDALGVYDCAFMGDALMAFSLNNGAFMFNGETWDSVNDGFNIPGNEEYPLLRAISGDADGLSAVDNDHHVWHFDGARWQITHEWFPSALQLRRDGLLASVSFDGIYFSNDEGASWTRRCDGLLYINCSDLAIVNNSLLAISRYSVFRSDDEGAHWRVVVDSAMTEWAVDGGTVYGLHFRKRVGAPAATLYRSDDIGDSWEPLNNDLRLGDPDYDATPADWNANISDLHHDGAYLYASLFGYAATGKKWTHGGMRRSADKGETWEVVNAGLPRQDGIAVPVSSISSTADGLMITTLGGPYVSDDQGMSWTAVNTLLPDNSTYLNMTALGNRLFAEALKGPNPGPRRTIYHSDDGGANWREIDSLFDREHPTRLLLPRSLDAVDGETYLHAEDKDIHALFRLVDDHWKQVRVRLPLGMYFNKLVGGATTTYGLVADNGVWRNDGIIDDVAQATDGPSAHRLYPNPFGDRLTLEIDARGGAMTLSLFNSAGVEILSRRFYAGASQPVEFELPAGLAAGLYFYRIDAPDGAISGALVRMAR